MLIIYAKCCCHGVLLIVELKEYSRQANALVTMYLRHYFIKLKIDTFHLVEFLF